MPSRGAPWRGAGKGTADRIASGEIVDESITSADILDGTIQESDLDSALQSKVNTSGGHVLQDEGTPLTQQSNLNFVGAGVTAIAGGEDTSIVTIPGGGGNVEVVLDATVPSNLVSHTLAFDRSIALDGTDVGLVKIVISDIGLSANDIINIGFNGDSTGMTSKGVSSNGTTVTAVQETSVTDGISWSTSGGSVIIEIPGDIFSAGGSTGCFAKFSDITHYSNIAFNLQSSAFDPLTNIIIKSKLGIVTVNTSTRIVAYAFNKD